jgi:hypothetical protein
MKTVLRRLDAVQDLGPVQRFAFGIACGVFTALGMWLISTLSHAEKANLGLTWQTAVAVVLFMGITSLATRRKKR